MGNAKAARKTKIYVDGYDLSRYFNQADTDNSCPPLDSTTFDEPTADTTCEAGVPEGKASLKGFYFAKAGDAVPANRDAVDDVLNAIIGDETKSYAVTIAQEGMDAQGLATTLFKTKVTKYSVTAPHDQLVSCMAEMQADGGLRYGVALAQHVSRTATGQGAAYDLGAASTKGFECNLHGLVFGATTSVVVVVEDSADGTTGWATIGTFTSTNARGAQRLEVTGNVRRYVRARWTITGTNGVTFVVSFALKVY